MTDSRPTLHEFRTLYKAAMRVKEIAPWEWMTETDVFGVENPESNEIGFVSVMGMLGQHLALALYPDTRALYRFWDVHHMGGSAPPESVLEIPQLQASFENRDQLSREDRHVMRELGLTFRGRQAWPMFRSYRPGYSSGLSTE